MAEMVASGARARVNTSFFFWMSGLLFLVVLLGFAPTFYLRPFMDEASRDLPGYLFMHGVFMTAWYGGLLAQTGLVAFGNRSLHRKLGLWGLAVATGVVVTGAITAVQFLPRAADFNLPPEAGPSILTGNTMNLTTFIVLVTWAGVWRHRPDWHKRFMLIASIAVIGPALTTNRMFGEAIQSFMPDGLSFSISFWLLALAALALYDWRRDGRIHRATIYGSGIKIVTFGIAFALISSGAATKYAEIVNRLNG